MAGGWSVGDNASREQLSALRSLLALSMLVTQQNDEATILHLVANAVEALGPCQTERILLDGQWLEVRAPYMSRVTWTQPTSSWRMKAPDSS